MLGFGKKRREEKEAEAKRIATLAAAEKRQKEMEALAANPVVAAKAAQGQALIAAQVANDSSKVERESKERQEKIEIWMANNKEEAEKITRAAMLKVFIETGLPQDNLEIFQFYCTTPFLNSGRKPGVFYMDGEGCKVLGDLFHARIKEPKGVSKGNLALIQRLTSERQDEWIGLDFVSIKLRVYSELEARIMERLSTTK